MRGWLMVSKTARQWHLCGNPTPSIKYGRASFVIKFYELLIGAVNYCENKDQEQKAPLKISGMSHLDFGSPWFSGACRCSVSLGSLRPWRRAVRTSPAVVLWNCKWWGQPTSALLVVAASTEHAICNGWAVLQMAVARLLKFCGLLAADAAEQVGAEQPEKT